MTSSNAPFDDEDQPLSPEQERIVRKVWRLVIFGGVIIAAGFVLVVVTVISRLSNPVETAVIDGNVDGLSELKLAKGEKLKSASLQEGRLTLLIETDAGSVIRILNAETLDLLKEIKVQNPE